VSLEGLTEKGNLSKEGSEKKEACRYLRNKCKGPGVEAGPSDMLTCLRNNEEAGRTGMP
jgi:hypothetical protein